jgi:hypothetical protein
VKYKCIGLGGYDSTGTGSAYAAMTEVADLELSPINLGGSLKMTYITILQKMMSKGLLQMPDVGRAFWQLARYTYPEPQKLKQDIVMMLVVTAAVLQPMWSDRYDDIGSQKPEQQPLGNRYDRPLRERHGVFTR